MLVNKSNLRKLILDTAKQTRHHKFSRVSALVYMEADRMMAKWAEELVRSQPSVGKTIIPK